MSDRPLIILPHVSSGGRLPALDQLRGFVIVLVVLHHSILAYCTFGHVDTVHYILSTAPIVDGKRWIGFDLAVLLNDGFFMPLLFLLSGLFVKDSLVRQTPAGFLRMRLLRLGLPFAIAELTVVPLAYYPSFLQAGGQGGFPGFWLQTVTMGPWPSGPPWFIGILLLFDAAATLVLPRQRKDVPPCASHSGPGTARYFGLLLAGSILLYLPLLIGFGPARWISVGPVAIQASRILLYGTYFTAGVALGASGKMRVERFGCAIACRWGGWAMLTLLTAAAFVAAQRLMTATPSVLPRWVATGVVGVTLAVYCAAACFAFPALFLRFAGQPGRFWNSLGANSFAIYLLHYPAVTWVQYVLLPVSASAFAKAAISFGVALAASWTGAVLLRRVPGVARAI